MESSILSLQLPFAIVPLVLFTSNKEKMGEFVNSKWVTILAWIVTVIIIVLNIFLVGYIFVTGHDLG